MQLFAGLETDCFAWGDRDLSAGAWIASDAGLAWLYGEDPEASQFNSVARDKGLFHAVEYCVNR